MANISVSARLMLTARLGQHNHLSVCVLCVCVCTVYLNGLLSRSHSHSCIHNIYFVCRFSHSSSFLCFAFCIFCFHFFCDDSFNSCITFCYCGHVVFSFFFCCLNFSRKRCVSLQSSENEEEIELPQNMGTQQ